MSAQKLLAPGIYLISILFVTIGCNPSTIRISDLSGTKVGGHAGNELKKYLNMLYDGREFTIVENETEADIQYVLASQLAEKGYDVEPVPVLPESYKLVNYNGNLLVIAPDERGLLNGTYALLEKLGCGFYISGDVIPEKTKWKGTAGWEMEDQPLTGDRFIFNWHNFLSGCTGWDLPDWQLWIDQANKMRYNGIMVHAYGNNPMFSFEYLGERKTTGYLNNTLSGRDWGNQHVNDVRRMAGGKIFDGPVYGAQASLVSAEDKDSAATALMQHVFQYAEDRGTQVIFALDFDTWMANPRNIIEKLPREALFELGDGHLTPNPEHPAGIAYYENVLRSLLKTYPEIDQLSIWHRRPSLNPGLGTIWMNFPYEKLPASWKAEYKDKLLKHPEIVNDLRATSTFAYGKLIGALQKARDKIKPDLKLSSGSWEFDYVPLADVFYPRDIALLPLDWSVVFDQANSKEILAKAGKNRQVYPIIWAHHDDHRYIGRPYIPWKNFSSMLQDRNAAGFGIIHWTTRPLDLYFTSSARQVWSSTKNEPLRTSVEQYVSNLFGFRDVQLTDYFHTWVTEGPMFGRETSDHFIDLGNQQLGHNLESWEEMKEKTLERLDQIGVLPGIEGNHQLMYQKQMEEFYLSFFNNQMRFQTAFEYAETGKIEDAIVEIKKADPETTIEKYVSAINHIGFTSGEKALVFTMNTRWLADFYNLEQRLGLKPVGFLFSPTNHDSLAQAPGHFTYHIDDQNAWWRGLWKREMVGDKFANDEEVTMLSLNGNKEFELRTMHGQALSPGIYQVDLLLASSDKNSTLILQQKCDKKVRKIEIDKYSDRISAKIDLEHGNVIELSAPNGLLIRGMVITKK